MVHPADTAPVAASREGVLHGMPGEMWAIQAVAAHIPIGARLITQLHGFLCATLTPLLSKVVHPLWDLRGVMRYNVA